MAEVLDTESGDTDRRQRDECLRERRNRRSDGEQRDGERPGADRKQRRCMVANRIDVASFAWRGLADKLLSELDLAGAQCQDRIPSPPTTAVGASARIFVKAASRYTYSSS